MIFYLCWKIKNLSWFLGCYTQAVVAATTTSVVVTGFQRGKTIQYREFSNTKPPKFRSGREHIIDLIWIFDVEGCFYTFRVSRNRRWNLHLIFYVGCEGLVEICDPWIFACRASHIDWGTLFIHVPSGVCTYCGARVTGTEVCVGQADDWFGDRYHQDVSRETESYFLLSLWHFKIHADVPILMYAQDRYFKVWINSVRSYFDRVAVKHQEEANSVGDSEERGEDNLSSVSIGGQAFQFCWLEFMNN